MRDFSATVSKKELLTRLRANRSGHREAYSEAFANYRARMVADLEAKLDKIKKGEAVDPYLRFTAPEDHSKEYNEVIEMLEMDQGDTVTLDQSQFRAYVMDDWNWKQQWTTSNQQYLT